MKRRVPSAVLAAVSFLLPLSACTGGNPPTKVTSRTRPVPLAFETHEVVVGAAERQTVMTGFLLGAPLAELAVVTIDENDDRRLCIYAFEGGTWVANLHAKLRPEVSFVDVGKIDGRDRLVTYERGRLSWFDPESATERGLVSVPSSFDPPRRRDIPHVDVTRDVNDDGHDDLVVPDVDGFWVVIQKRDGTFAEPLKVGAPSKFPRFYGIDGYRYDPWSESRVHEMDYNLDGRSDLVFWKGDHFEVHLQTESGLFASLAETFTTDVAFDSDDLASLAAPIGIRRRRYDHNFSGVPKGTVLYSLADQNGDGVADLVLFSLDGGRKLTWRSTYEVHFGAATPDGIVFSPQVGTAIRSRGIPFGLGQHDFGGDGQVDTMFTNLKLSGFRFLGLLARGMLTNSALLDLEIYRMGGGVYPNKPNATRKIKGNNPGVSGEQAMFLPSVLVGDVNGDSLSDLLVGKDREELRVFLGVPGPGLFAPRPQNVAVAMPNEEFTWLVDLNKDGKQDILMHHPSTTEPHRVTILMAQ